MNCYLFHAFYDTWCYCTILRPIGLQLASSLGIKVTSYDGLPVRMANGAQKRAVHSVGLPATVANVSRNLTVLILLNLDCDRIFGLRFCDSF